MDTISLAPMVLWQEVWVAIALFLGGNIYREMLDQYTDPIIDLFENLMDSFEDITWKYLEAHINGYSRLQWKYWPKQYKPDG